MLKPSRPHRLFCQALILLFAVHSGNTFAETIPTSPEADWSRQDALQAIDAERVNQTASALLSMARTGQSLQLAQAIRTLQSKSEFDLQALSLPESEQVLWKLAIRLGDLDPWQVSASTLKLLIDHQSPLVVTHDDSHLSGSPLFDVAAAASGSRNRWLRESARRHSLVVMDHGPDAWLNAYQAAGTVAQRGYIDSLADLPVLAADSLIERFKNSDLAVESIALAATELALRASDADLEQRLMAYGHASALPPLFRGMAAQRTKNELFDQLEWAVDNHHLEAADLAAAHWLPLLGDEAPTRKSQDTSQPQADGARIVEWVENAPASDTSVIALGYPVPMPVNTPMPFAGFRAYQGLHLRHQQLAADTPWVHPHTVGETLDGRTIWAYQLGDANRFTRYGQLEQAMLSNGGIHAREWQSPEVTTGIIELLAQADDQHLISYLRDNANMLVIPVLNIDGFLQTQRYPSLNWLGADVDDPDNWPRDGRMRRKNMRGADEVLETEADHLQGVDLNRNNAPFWASSSRSSSNSESIVHHGASAASEPEIQALEVAAQLGPASQLSMYTDLHSFSQVHFWVRNSNQRLTTQTQQLLGSFSRFHAAFPAGKWYSYASGGTVAKSVGIGSTDEYFTHIYQVPAWTLEIEPRGGAGQAGIDYGGLGRNGHDGFILPESEVPRVRTELAQTFAVAYYRQAGPPALTEFQVIDSSTGAVVFKAEWDASGDTGRTLHRFQSQPLQTERDYTVWMAWNKPMRWRDEGKVIELPGSSASLDLDIGFTVDGQLLDIQQGTPEWLMVAGGAPEGFAHYRDDAVALSLRIPANAVNNPLLEGEAPVTAAIRTYDMTGHQTDPMPQTVARWEAGGWSGYENDSGTDGDDTGGTDTSISFQATNTIQATPFVVEPGLSSAWYDMERNGEGFVLEVIDPKVAVMYWFTYDDDGEQKWYTATGRIQGNQAIFDELIAVTGGRFGPDFDPNEVVRTVVGRASFTWSSCEAGSMQWSFDSGEQEWRAGRMDLIRITQLLGAECGSESQGVEPERLFSGSWYDPSHNGEGFVLQMLPDAQALVYWFSFDGDGQPRWFFGLGDVNGGNIAFNEMFTTDGPLFADAFDARDLNVFPWGSLNLQLSCAGGTASFTPSEGGFLSGSLDLIQLTHIEGLACDP